MISISDLSLDRTVYYSDAVIAIALTLLALGLPVPLGEDESEVWASFVENLSPDYLSFVISFLVISAFWLSHHRFFQKMARVSRRLMRWNLISLFAIVLVPFATKVLTAHGEIAFGPVLYAGVMALFGLSYLFMVRVAGRDGLWREEVPAGFAADATAGMGTVFGVFVLSIPLAFVNPSLAQFSWLLMPVIAALLPKLRSRGLASQG
ncbi:MAG TPA: DUF1211 domain-containing protein [Micromonosporaceae bacterium]|nr:DUF1211 domain-containing protein [Micromonosporaceae bacterium]